jgi:hypothetical protein
VVTSPISHMSELASGIADLIAALPTDGEVSVGFLEVYTQALSAAHAP